MHHGGNRLYRASLLPTSVRTTGLGEKSSQVTPRQAWARRNEAQNQNLSWFLNIPISPISPQHVAD